MLEEERQRQQYLEGSIKAHEIVKGFVVHAVESFAMNKDLDSLVKSAREAFEVANRYHPFAPISFASLYTDELARRRRGKFNQEIIEQAEERGITPWPNFMGERLQATTCLAQLLETPAVVSR